MSKQPSVSREGNHLHSFTHQGLHSQGQVQYRLTLPAGVSNQLIFQSKETLPYFLIPGIP